MFVSKGYYSLFRAVTLAEGPYVNDKKDTSAVKGGQTRLADGTWRC
jgi:hypothetical protein